MAFSEVGGGSQRGRRESNNVDSDTLAFPANVASGSLLIVCGGCWQTGSGNTGFTVTDTQGTSYTVLKSTTGIAWTSGTGRAFIAYGIAPSAGADTVTLDPSGTGNYATWYVDEFSGTSPVLDVDGGESTGNGFTPADDITTVGTNDLVVGVSVMSGLGTFDPGAGYTQIGEDESANRQPNLAEFQIVTTATTYTVNCSISIGRDWSVITAAFKETVVASPFPVSLPTMSISARSRKVWSM